jgi:hypothetical protein
MSPSNLSSSKSCRRGQFFIFAGFAPDVKQFILDIRHTARPLYNPTASGSEVTATRTIFSAVKRLCQLISNFDFSRWKAKSGAVSAVPADGIYAAS